VYSSPEKYLQFDPCGSVLLLSICLLLSILMAIVAAFASHTRRCKPKIFLCRELKEDYELKKFSNYFEEQRPKSDREAQRQLQAMLATLLRQQGADNGRFPSSADPSARGICSCIAEVHKQMCGYRIMHPNTPCSMLLRYKPSRPPPRPRLHVIEIGTKSDPNFHCGDIHSHATILPPLEIRIHHIKIPPPFSFLSKIDCKVL
jgi:hypothetical protein